MKTYWNGQELDTSKEYKITTVNSIVDKTNPWYVTELLYNKRFKMFSFKSAINNEAYGMGETNVVSIEEVTK